jgi:sorting nexin-8
MGLQGNLWPGEIQEQLIHALSLRSVSNIVFMGMGEPLENYDALTSSINGLVDSHRFGLAPSGITVSTVGIIPNMRRLMNDLPKVKLAISLHAPNQDLREQLLPVAKAFKMDQLLEVVDDYAAKITSDGKRKGMVMVSYVLLEGVNDTLECAHQLRELVKDRPVIVNLIPYNPFEGNVHDYKTPSAERVDDFLKVLVDAGVRVFERRHHGRDIAAACGQLAKLGSSAPADDIENCSCLLSKERVRIVDAPAGVPSKTLRFASAAAPDKLQSRRRLSLFAVAVSVVAAASVVTALLRQRRSRR